MAVQWQFKIEFDSIRLVSKQLLGRYWHNRRSFQVSVIQHNLRTSWTTRWTPQSDNMRRSELVMIWWLTGWHHSGGTRGTRWRWTLDFRRMSLQQLLLLLRIHHLVIEICGRGLIGDYSARSLGGTIDIARVWYLWHAGVSHPQIAIGICNKVIVKEVILEFASETISIVK